MASAPQPPEKSSANPAKGNLYTVNSKQDALHALYEINDQGEGHSGKMFDKQHELTHYWKFKAIYDLMDAGLWDYNNEVYNLAKIPHEDKKNKEATYKLTVLLLLF